MLSLRPDRKVGIVYGCGRHRSPSHWSLLEVSPQGEARIACQLTVQSLSPSRLKTGNSLGNSSCAIPVTPGFYLIRLSVHPRHLSGYPTVSLIKRGKGKTFFFLTNLSRVYLRATKMLHSKLRQLILILPYRAHIHTQGCLAVSCA